MLYVPAGTQCRAVSADVYVMLCCYRKDCTAADGDGQCKVEGATLNEARRGKWSAGELVSW